MTSEKIESRVRRLVNAVANDSLSCDLACEMITNMIKRGAPGETKKKAYEHPQLSAKEWAEISGSIRTGIKLALLSEKLRIGSVDLDQGKVTVWFDEKSPHPLE